MKKFALFFLFFSLQIFSQSITNSDEDKEFKIEEHFGGKRVFINKTITSYNFTSSIYKNNKEIKSKMHVNFDNPEPSKIFINSNDNNVTIRINSRYFREDLFFKFKRIYKIEEEDGKFFYKFMGNSSCITYYFIPKDGYNQFLNIKCLDENKNGSGLSFTMSQLEQL